MIHLQKMTAKGIDHTGMANRGDPLGRIAEMGVNVAMDEIARFESADELDETFETAMTTVLGIVNVPGRRMGDDDVNAASQPKPRHHAPNHPAHLVFPILNRPAIIPARPLQPHDPQAFEGNPTLVQIHTPHRWGVAVADVVVAADVKQRRIQLFLAVNNSKLQWNGNSLMETTTIN